MLHTVTVSLPFLWKKFSVIFVLVYRAVVNLPETLGTHFSLKITALRDQYLSVAISSGLIIIWKCRKVLGSVSYKFLCGRKYCF